ncbi:scavenger receptor cysteine-rich domain superfamily protein-like isoform X3 [Halichondria panicea]|uniref:scavenger receptor cysteine-rich domain superfamily protein-like isoform X3 n=1 Tax=Halichondria panicea TaxID=6063 RepID=UPI00312B4E0D
MKATKNNLFAFTRIVMANISSLLVTLALVGQLSADKLACNNGILRLVRLDDQVTKSYVQYCLDGEWCWLCGKPFSRVEANVVCRQHGYSDQGATKGFNRNLASMSISGGFFRFNFGSCSGRENALAECERIEALSNCNSNQQGWVKCNPVDCPDGAVRLVGGSTIRQGRVEVCQNQRWGTMCYNQVLAGHVCSQLGFPSQAAVSNVISTTSPQVSCTMDTNNRLSCGNITDSGLCARGLAVECPSFCETCPNSSTLCMAPSDIIEDQTTANSSDPPIPSSSISTSAVQNTTMHPRSPITSVLGVVIGLLALLEVGTVIAWVACTVTRKRNSSPTKQRILTKVNESYNGTFLKQPNVSSQDPNYDTVTTSNEAVSDYDVIDNFKPKPRALQISNPPPVTVEASN